MTTTTAPQVAITRVLDYPPSLVYRAFTEPEQIASFWGPHGNLIDEVEVDIRPGGYLSWHETFPPQPDVWTNGRIDLTDAIENELLDGRMRITGHLPGGFQPFETRMRIEFHEEPDGRTRLEISQWLPESYAEPTRNGWDEQFEKLEATLAAKAR